MTHISRVTTYPADPLTGSAPRDVAHFAHPLELSWLSRGGPEPPSPSHYPALFLQARAQGGCGCG